MEPSCAAIARRSTPRKTKSARPVSVATTGTYGTMWSRSLNLEDHMKPSLTRYKKSRRGYLTVLLITTTMLTFAPLTTHMASITHQRHTQSQLVTAVAHRQGLNPRLLHSWVLVESSGKPSAISKKGAIGLSQVHWPTWKHKWSKKDLMDPERNLMAGTEILL